jgi:hypothetical protein
VIRFGLGGNDFVLREDGGVLSRNHSWHETSSSPQYEGQATDNTEPDKQWFPIASPLSNTRGWAVAFMSCGPKTFRSVLAINTELRHTLSVHFTLMVFRLLFEYTRHPVGR